MSYPSHSRTFVQSVARTRLLEVRHAVDAALSTSIRVDDPAYIAGLAEAFLDKVAADIAADPLRCADCNAPLPEYRHRRWYLADQDPQVFDVVCPSCAATREDIEAETLAFTASR